MPTLRQKIEGSNCGDLHAFKHDGTVVTVYCGKWSCKRCSKVNANRWAWRVRLYIGERGETAWFWTFTLGISYRTRKSGYLALPRLWDTLRKELQRQFGKWQYCAFVEGQPHRGSMPHFHVISLVKSPRRIKDLAVHVGFGHQAYEEPVNDKKAAHYVAKYASKTDAQMPTGFRRVRTSRGWPKLPPYHGERYMVKSSLETLADYLLRVSDVSGIEPEILERRWTNSFTWED